MASWEDVCRIASALPGAEESTSYRQPCFKANGRPFVGTSREPGAIWARCRREEAPLLVSALPGVYFLTPHYEGWDGVLVRLAAIDEDELAGRLEDAHEYVSALPPPRRRR